MRSSAPIARHAASLRLSRSRRPDLLGLVTQAGFARLAARGRGWRLLGNWPRSRVPHPAPPSQRLMMAPSRWTGRWKDRRALSARQDFSFTIDYNNER